MNRDQGSLEDGELAPERDPLEVIDPTRAWTGLPAFEPTGPRETRLVVTFETEAQRDEIVERLGLIIAKKTKGTWSAWWPPRHQADLSSLYFEIEDPGRFTDLSPQAADADDVEDEAAFPSREEIEEARRAFEEAP